MYQKIEETFWTDPKVSNLIPHEKLLFIYLITNSHAHYSGLYQISKAIIQDETNLTPDAIEEGLTCLTNERLIRYDSSKKIVWVINMAKHQIQQGNKLNLIKGFARQFERLHKSALIKDFLIYYASLVNGILNPSEWDTDTMPESVTETEALNRSIKQETKALKKEGKKSYDSDPEWLETLKLNPAYQHIDIACELGKMEAWLTLPKNKARKKTRQFILNWLNKIDKPINMITTGLLKWSEYADTIMDMHCNCIQPGKEEIIQVFIKKADYPFYKEQPRTVEEWEKFILSINSAVKKT